MADVKVVIDGTERLSPTGLISVASLYEIAGLDQSGLFWKRADGTEVPLSPAERMQIRGGEVFVSGDPVEDDNPALSEGICPEFNGSRDVRLPHAKMSGKALKAHDGEFPDGRLFLALDGELDVEIEDDAVTVVQEEDVFWVIPRGVGDDGAVDIEACGQHGRRPPRHRLYRIRLDREKRLVDTREISGRRILELVGKSYHEWSLNQKLHGGRRVRIAPEENVDLSKPGIERFETVRKQAQQGSGA